MTKGTNPFEPPLNSNACVMNVTGTDASLAWSAISFAIFLVTWDAYFGGAGLWSTLISHPLTGIVQMTGITGLCGLVYAPMSFLLRKLFGYRYELHMALTSGFLYAVSLLASNYFFSSASGLQTFIVHSLTCLGCTMPVEIAVGMHRRLQTGTIPR